MEIITGSAGNDTINAVAASPTTGAAITTINSGDSIDGGAGTDTLNLTITATNNTSLAGLTVSNVEIVNVSGANNQNTAAAALSTATASKASTAAALVARNAEALLAAQQDAAADEIVLIAGTTNGGASNITRVGEAALASATAVTATTAPQLFNAAKYVGDRTATEVLADSTATALPAGVTGFTLAQLNAAAAAALRGADGVAFAAGSADITDRADALLKAAYEVWVAVGAAASSSDVEEQQLADAAAAIRTGINAAADNAAAVAWVDAAIAITSAGFTALGTNAYSQAQYVAAATAAKSGHTGATLTTKADLLARATDLRDFRADAAAVAGDFTVAQLNTAATSARSAANGTSLLTVADDQVALVARATELATTSQAVLTAANTAATTALNADVAAANALSVATTNAATATASVSGSQFTGASQVWLVGAESNRTSLTVGAGQTAGLNGVTSLSNTTTFGTTGTLAVAASGGTTDIAGAASGLTITGTTTAGTTGLVLTNTGGTTAALGVKTLAVDMSGASIFDVSGMGQLTTVTIGNTGAVTINPKTNTKLASVTSTGTGADTVRIATATAIDDPTTASVNETVSALVSTGVGADVVTVATSGAGTTTITTAAGADTVYVASVGTGISSINTGDDNDTVHLNVALGANPNLSINAGAGTDTLVMAGPTSLSAVDYARMNTALSGFEAIRFNSEVGATTAVDVSKFAIGTLAGFTFNAGTSVVTEVGAQTLTLARAASVTATDFVPGFTGVAPSGLNASAAGYVVGAGAVATVQGGNLTVATSGSSTVALTLKGAAATVGVTATGAGSTTSYAPTATLSGSDLTALTVNLTSARGTSTNAAAEYMSTFAAGTIVNTAATTYGEHLEALASLRVNGSGVFTINTGTVAKTLAKLTTVDVSGMTAFADQDVNGLVEATYLNRSTTTITLNNNVSETVILGGARDTVATSSTYANMDTITGFQLTGNATTPTVVDTARSDRIDLGALGAFAKFTTTATTLIGALTAAGADAGARLVFTFGGDTYVYVDLAAGGTSVAGLDDGDILVKLTGSYDLDLLIQTGVII